MKKHLKNKIRLVLHNVPYQSHSLFHSEWFKPILAEHFIFEHYDPEKHYEKDTVFIIGARHYWTPSVREQFQEYRVLVDALWESYTGKYQKIWGGRFPNHTIMYGNYHPTEVDGAIFVPNWFWYNESLWYHSRNYHLEEPSRRYFKKFLLPIGHLRGWREEVLNACEPYLEDAYWSCIDRGQMLPFDNQRPSKKMDYRYQDPRWYNDTCFSLVLESARSWEEAIVFITEKTWKPVSFRHPFIIVGQQGILKYLKSQGFETFDNMFDESYDNVSDFKTKLSIIMENVTKYYKEPYSEETIRRLDHNHALFYNQERVKQGLYDDLLIKIKNFVTT